MAKIESESIEQLSLFLTSETEPDGTFGVEFQFLPPGVNPAPGGWTAGTVVSWSEYGCDWQTKVLTPLLGPGHLVIPEGQYVTWIRVTGGSELVVMRAGPLVVA
jgi:hypothetical protein